MNRIISQNQLSPLLLEHEQPIYDSFTMAFQPIWDAANGRVYGYEALVRDHDGSSAAPVFARVPLPARYDFDRMCRMKGIELAARLGMQEILFLNFYSNSVLTRANGIEATIDAARAFGFPANRMILEFTEHEDVEDMQALRRNVADNIHTGFRTAMDDFGAGYSGLNLLCRVTPDFIKIDRAIIAEIDKNPRRYRIVSGLVRLLLELNHTIIVEGVETYGEYQTLVDLGAQLFQGYFLARPEIARLATADEILQRITPPHAR